MNTFQAAIRQALSWVGKKLSLFLGPGSPAQCPEVQRLSHFLQGYRSRYLHLGNVFFVFLFCKYVLSFQIFNMFSSDNVSLT